MECPFKGSSKSRNSLTDVGSNPGRGIILAVPCGEILGIKSSDLEKCITKKQFVASFSYHAHSKNKTANLFSLYTFAWTFFPNFFNFKRNKILQTLIKKLLVFSFLTFSLLALLEKRHGRVWNTITTIIDNKYCK